MKFGNSIKAVFIGLFLAVFYGQVAFGATINVDIESAPGGTTYVGDDGVLSSAGGITWNSVTHFVNASNLLDEYGNGTGVGVSWQGSDFGASTDPSATNDLQDSGTWGDGFDITGLQAGGVYDLAIYAMQNAGGAVTDANGSSWDFWTIGGAPTYNLPGVQGQDYALYTGLVAFDLGGGEFGIRLDSFDGSVVGFQLMSEVPVPAAAWLFGSALLGLGALKRKKA